MAKEPGYKEAMEELESIAHTIEHGQPDMDELAGLVKRAKELIQLCKGKLKKTSQEVDQAIQELDDDANP